MRKHDIDSDVNALIEYFKHFAQEYASAYVVNVIMREHSARSDVNAQ